MMSSHEITERSMGECGEEETQMFHVHNHAYPACAYYVQSPSTISHANTFNIINNDYDSAAFHSRTRSELTASATTKNNLQAISRLTTLSRGSSSRGSNSSFSHDVKKVITTSADDDEELHAHAAEAEAPQNRLIIVYNDDDDDDDDDDGWYHHYGNDGGCWRLLLSLGVALLVFYMASKPPPPLISIKIAGIRQFGLGEGVDSTGVATKILTSNCSVDLLVDNKSKLFGLHISPPVIDMSFGRLPIASSHGPKLYAASHDSSLFRLYVGTRNKPMYGAGRNMQDLLELGKGLPLIIRMSFRTNYRVVWDLIKPEFHHEAECLLLLNRKYDKKHRTQVYNSTCITIS
ncbi:Delta-latroinsectotoxin-Lt1a protein [Citrus sinensis]|nr:Delta-latroinsectotoxin-Lt1a protein [Citrus sinensis]